MSKIKQNRKKIKRKKQQSNPFQTICHATKETTKLSMKNPRGINL
jgi:hypothetical protein